MRSHNFCMVTVGARVIHKMSYHSSEILQENKCIYIFYTRRNSLDPILSNCNRDSNDTFFFLMVGLARHQTIKISIFG